MPLYWSNVEFSYRADAAEEKAQPEGMFFVFLVADDVRHALQRIEKAVAEQGVDITSVEFVTPYKDCGWEDPADEELYAKLSQQALASSEVVFDDAWTYGEE